MRNRILSKDEIWFLEGTMSGGKVWIIPIDRTPFVIGRNPDSNLVLASEDISRQHAELYVQIDGVYIRDMKSTNGTFINSTRIKNKVKLNDNDTLHFGEIKFKIVSKRPESDDYAESTQYMKIKKESNSFVEYYELTKREEEVLYLLLEGVAVKKIADKLFISEGTAKNHSLNIFRKTNVHSKFELLTLYNSFQKEKES